MARYILNRRPRFQEDARTKERYADEIFRLMNERVGDFQALSVDPPDADLSANNFVIWQSDGTDTGDDGDIIIKIKDSSGSVKTGTLVDYSTL